MSVRRNYRLFALLLLLGALAVILAVLLPADDLPSAAQQWRTAATPMEPPFSAHRALIDRLQQLTGGQTRISYHAQTGKVRFIGASATYPIPRLDTIPADTPPEEAARSFLSAYGELFGLTDQATELALMRFRVVDRDRSFVRFQQVYQGIPALGGELVVQMDENKNVVSAMGEVLPDPRINVVPTISAATARLQALEMVAQTYGLGVEALTATEPELWLFNPVLIRPGEGFTELVWRMDVTSHDGLPVREFILVDARRGSVALSFSQIETTRNRETYTANNGTTLPGTLVCNEANPTCAGGDSHAVAAHIHAGDTYDFYLSTHGRDSLNNAGMTLVSTVHYKSGYANAGWTGTQMIYGDAYGYPLADDVVAHELTHGVTQYESNLFYYYQSGAINESFSDLWGEFVDLTNGRGNDDSSVRWLMGEDVSGQGAGRDMKNPPAFSDPDKMTSSVIPTDP